MKPSIHAFTFWFSHTSDCILYLWFFAALSLTTDNTHTSVELKPGSHYRIFSPDFPEQRSFQAPRSVPQPPPMCSIHLDDVTAATGKLRQCAHHTPATGGEERESLSQPSVWGLLGGHDWQGPVVGIWPGHRGYTPTLYEKCHGIFDDHRESGPRFKISSEWRCFFTV